MGKTLLTLIGFLALPWGWVREVAPGEVFLLTFPGVKGRLSWEVAPFRGLLLTEESEGLGVAVLEAPPVPPGEYAVCLSWPEGKLCQTVRVKALASLAAEVSPEMGSLALRFLNRGNLPERVSWGPAPENPLPIPPGEALLSPGEERTLRFSLPQGGEGVLLLRYGGKEERHLVRVQGEEGAPPLYRLAGLLQGRWPPSLGLSLEGGLARGLHLAMALEGWEQSLALRGTLQAPPWTLQVSPSRLALGYDQGPLGLSLAFPWGLEGAWREGFGTYRLSLSPREISLGVALPGTTLRVGYRGEPFLRWEGVGALAHFLAYEEGLRFGVRGDGAWAEGMVWPEGALRVGFQGAWGNMAYALEGEWSGGRSRLDLRAQAPLPPWGLEGGLHLSSSPSLTLGLGYGAHGWEAGLRVGVGSGGSRGELRLALSQGHLSLWGSLGGGPEGLRLALEGRYAFNLEVPREVSLALGGYDRAPVEGVVLLGGKALEGAEVVFEGVRVKTDGGGRFRFWLPREGGLIKVHPPPGVLALPLEAFLRPGKEAKLSLPEASLLRLRCLGEGEGARFLGAWEGFLPCGGEVLLPPGEYRLEPRGKRGTGREGKEARLEPLKEVEVEVAFSPPEAQQAEGGEPLEVLLPSFPPAPGEEVALEVRGGGGTLRLRAGEEVLWEGKPGESLRFQVPWEASSPLVLEAWTDGRVRAYPLSLDPSRPLLVWEEFPRRASPGEEIRLRLRTRFPAQEVLILLPRGKALPLRPLGEGLWDGKVRLEEGWTEGGLLLEARARQGDRVVESRVRVLPKR